MQVLFELDAARLFPEDLALAKEILRCKEEDIEKYLKKWENYWDRVNRADRLQEGIKKRVLES